MRRIIFATLIAAATFAFFNEPVRAQENSEVTAIIDEAAQEWGHCISSYFVIGKGAEPIFASRPTYTPHSFAVANANAVLKMCAPKQAAVEMVAGVILGAARAHIFVLQWRNKYFRILVGNN